VQANNNNNNNNNNNHNKNHFESIAVIVVLLLPPLTIMENGSCHQKIGMCHGIWLRNLSIISNLAVKIEPSNENKNNKIIIVPLHPTFPLRIVFPTLFSGWYLAAKGGC
jgi:hypothetical protein